MPDFMSPDHCSGSGSATLSLDKKTVCYMETEISPCDIRGFLLMYFPLGMRGQIFAGCIVSVATNIGSHESCVSCLLLVFV